MNIKPNELDVLNELTPSSIRTDGGTQSRAAIYQNVISDYAAAVLEGSIFPPVVVFYDGADYWLADGFHRVAAYIEAKAEAIPVDIRQGTRRDAVFYSVGANQSHGLRRTNEDKRRAVMTLLNDAEWSRIPQPDIAKHCGVSREYVNRLSVELAPSCDRSQDGTRTVTRNGTTYTQNTASIGKPAAPMPSMPFDPFQSKEIIEQAKAIVESDRDARIELKPFIAGPVRGTTGTGENEWYTPAEFIEKARTVLGNIDLDPASSEHAQKTVKADRFFTEKDDGLAHDWHGRIWLNPPYAQPFIEQFADKMIAEVVAQRVTSAIMLTHNYTDTAWFQKLARAASAICFTRGRVRFISPDDVLAAPTQGQAFFFFGSEPEPFFENFESVGFIAWIAK